MIKTAILFFLIASFSTGCFLRKNDKNKGPKVVLAFAEFESAFDWQRDLSLPGTIAATNLMEGLVDYDFDGNQAFVAPALAEKWESQQKNQEWEFKIKKDIFWSDGKPLTAEDFLFSFKRLLNAGTHSPYASILFPIKNAKEYFEGKIMNFNDVGIQVKGENILHFTLTKPMERFPHTFTHVSTYPMRQEHVNLFQAVKKEYDRTPWIGPFKLIHLTKKRISLVANEKSRHAGFHIKRVDLLTDNRREKLPKMIKEGKAHLVFNSDDVKMRSLRRFQLPAYEITYLSFLTKNKPLNNPIMRRVFSHCVNKDELVHQIPQSESLGGMIPPGVQGFESNRGSRYDPEMAKLVLKNAKYQDEIKKYEYIIYAQNSELLPLAKNLRDQWKKCLNVKIKTSDTNYVINPQAVGMVLQQLQGPSLDPTYYLGLFEKGSDKNITGWKNHEYDLFLRKPALARAQHLLVEEEIPVLPLLTKFHSVATQYQVRGIRQNFMRYIDLKNITLERSK